jgi:nucleoside-diphosphate-sugar epimerase
MKKKIKNIIGSGFLAFQFKKYDKLIKKLNICIYVAGVSNSLCKNQKELDRDYNRIKKFHKFIGQEKLIYISTCSIFDPNRKKSKYIKNKLRIETFIRKRFHDHTIVRYPELIGVCKNKNTLMNFFFNHISSSNKFSAYIDAKRNLLDVEDALRLTFYFLKQKKFKEINIANKKYYNVLKIIKDIEKVVDIPAIYFVKKNKFINWKIKNHVNNKILKILKIKFDKNYLSASINKHFA